MGLMGGRILVAVAVDWGWIRTHRRPTIRPPAEVLISETLLAEACTVEVDNNASASSIGFAQKASDFLDRHSERLLVARWPKEMVDNQIDHLASPCLMDVIELGKTAACRTRKSYVPDCDRLIEIRTRWGPLTNYWTSREAMVEFYRDWSGRMKLAGPEQSRLMSNVDNLTSAVRFPSLPCGFAAWYDSRFADIRWQERLSTFPDCTLVGRWFRLQLWYLLAMSGGRDLQPNDWDDQQYAYHASFTGHLATRDKGLRRVVETCYPHVKVYGDEEVLAFDV